MVNKQELTVAVVSEWFNRVIPEGAKQKFLFSQLLASVSFCETLGSHAWSISLLDDGFRLNVGPVEAMSCHFMYWNAADFGIDHDKTMVSFRVLLAGEDCLEKIDLSQDINRIDATNYKSIGQKNWCYEGIIEVNHNDIPGEGLVEVAVDLARLKDNHCTFLKLACHTSSGKIREKSSFARHHCQALYHYAKSVVADVAKSSVDIVKEFRDAVFVLPSKTESERLVIQRIGQNLFRNALLTYWQGRCCVTGLGFPELLRASHIKPWSECDTDEERLHLFNGLLLTPHLDALFDGGWITFDESGGLITSNQLGSEARAVFGLTSVMRLAKILPQHEIYMKFHRSVIFKG